MLEELTPTEMMAWQAYFSLNPFGEVREDYRHGILTSMVVQSSGRLRRGARVSPEKFIPRFEERSNKPQSWKVQLMFAEALTKAMGGQDLRKKAS